MDEKVRQGWPTGLAPFGYVNVEDKAAPVIPHPEQSKAVMRIFELYSTGNYAFKALRDQLAGEGFAGSLRKAASGNTSIIAARTTIRTMGTRRPVGMRRSWNRPSGPTSRPCGFHPGNWLSGSGPR